MSTRIQPGQSRVFDYMFADDPNTTMPELRERHGQTVTIVRDATPEEHEAEGGPRGYIVRFPDDYETLVFAEEVEG